MPILSIIVPMYNVKDYIEESISSIKNQTFKNFECIIVDDGSTDESYDLCLKLIQNDDRFKIYQKQNGGLSDARNYGLNLSKGKYIYFLDSDDSIYEDAMEKCINKLESTNSDIVIFEVMQYSFIKNNKELIKNKFDDNKIYNLKNEKTLLTNILNAAWNKVYLKSLFIDNNIRYPLGYYYEDLGTTYKLIESANSICFINEPLYKYKVDRPGNITQKFNTKVFNIIDMVNENINYFKSKGIFNEYYDELKFLCSINIIETLKKTRNAKYNKDISSFIDDCFKLINNNFNGFKNNKYDILRERNNWIYTNKYILKTYLIFKNIIRK